MLDTHPEDIKAALRKRHGTVGAFATARGFKPQAVADWLRGRTNTAVADAIAAELGEPVGHQGFNQSMNVDDSAAETSAHRLNAASR